MDDGVYPVQLQVSDGLLTATAESAVTVDNVAPSVDAGPDQTVPQGTAVNFTGRFTNPGARDTHTIQWDFGDGNTASGSLTPTHVYANEGTYTVTLTVTDDDGGTGTDSLTVTVQRGPEQTIHDLQARLKADKVELRWTPVAGAERYTIYRRTEGGSYTKLTDKAACTTCVHVDFGLAVNVKYYYVVTSWSRGVESLYSNEVSVTGQTLRGR